MAFLPQGVPAEYNAQPSDQLIRDLYRIGDALLVRSAPRELQPLRLRYVASRLRRIPPAYAQFAAEQRARDPDKRRQAPMIFQIADLLRPYVPDDTQANAQAGGASGPLDGHARRAEALIFLCVCAFEGLLDEMLRYDEHDMTLRLAQYFATDITLNQLSQQAGLPTGRLSSELSTIVSDLWNALPADSDDDFPFDRTLDFPLWELRRFRLLKHGG